MHVCGWRQNGTLTRQNNWLFTQHVDQDYDHSTYIYRVDIHVEVTFSLLNCSARDRCRQSFNLLSYPTSTVQLPTTDGRGFMNTANYRSFAQPSASLSSETYTRSYRLKLPRFSSGFYLAIQDIGSCLEISRVRVYRYQCASQQRGLVLYPDVPAPNTRWVTVSLTCVSNAIGSPTALCISDGTWGSQNHECRCRLGYTRSGNECLGRLLSSLVVYLLINTFF